MGRPVKVFISYSHDSEAHKQRVLDLADQLIAHGIDVKLDRYVIRPPESWPAWCAAQLEEVDFVLMICTQEYKDRIRNKVVKPAGKGVYWEGRIIQNYLYEEKGNFRFIPILLDGSDRQHIPQPIPNDTSYEIASFDVQDKGYNGLYRELTNQPMVIKPELGEIVKLEVPNIAPALPVKNTRRTIQPIMVDISSIDKYAPETLIGRENELAFLDAAWQQATTNETGRPRVVTFVALGGEGKTSLVSKWAAQLSAQNWPSCDAVFAYSFYSQGAKDTSSASSDVFLNEALIFFGDPELANSPADAFSKAKRLQQLVAAKRTLLILDGLEPLQYPPGSPMAGELKDHALAKLLKDLASQSQGLCLVTTRYEVANLKNFYGKSVYKYELKSLPDYPLSSASFNNL